MAHYHAVLFALRRRGITPLVTLHHYTLPAWLHDAEGCHVDVTTCKARGWLDEAGFTSYGGVVKVHANGYQVESTLPGGKRVALSGTSMASRFVVTTTTASMSGRYWIDVL